LAKSVTVLQEKSINEQQQKFHENKKTFSGVTSIHKFSLPNI